jgi:hypothetical protein
VDDQRKGCGDRVDEIFSLKVSRQKQLTKNPSASLRTRLRLFHLRARAKVCRRFPLLPVTHHYEEHIAGRTYEIEVRAVSQSRWRAQIARRPGMPTSLMPFYGATPDEAAQQLRRWLALVYNGTTKQ